MKKRSILSILGTLLLGSMACTAVPFLAPTATPTATLTPTLTPTLTSTATSTSTPTNTRTLTPTKIIGIEAPVMIGKAKLQFRKALRRDAFECGDSSYPTEDPGADEYLILTAKVTGGPVIKTNDDIAGWISTNGIDMLQIVDNNNHYSDEYTNICYQMDSQAAVTQVFLPFEVRKNADSFVLILPDDTRIPLDPLL